MAAKKKGRAKGKGKAKKPKRPLKATFGGRCRLAREKAGLNQTQQAKRMGLPPQVLNYQEGIDFPPGMRVYTLVKYCAGYGLNVHAELDNFARKFWRKKAKAKAKAKAAGKPKGKLKAKGKAKAKRPAKARAAKPKHMAMAAVPSSAPDAA